MKTAEDIIHEKNKEMVCIDPNQSVQDAVELMVSRRIGALLIKEGGLLVGIFTERDLLRNTAKKEFVPNQARVGDYMTSPLYTTSHDTPLLKLTEIFLGRYFRHLIIEKQGRPIGMISIGDALRASMLEKDRQIKELNEIAGWEYYESWGWDRKKS